MLTAWVGITGIVITDKVIGDYYWLSTLAQYWVGKRLGSTLSKITKQINSIHENTGDYVG